MTTDKPDWTYEPHVVRAALDTLFSELTDLEAVRVRADVVAGLNRLPNRERWVVVKHAQGYSYRELAAEMGVHHKSAYNWWHQGYVLLVLIVNPGIWKTEGVTEVEETG